MPAVRVSDALRYASKFVGLFLAIAIVAGGFIAGGVVLAADAINLADPSLSSLQETSVFIGIVCLAIGVILALVGMVALWYKFLVDGIAAAIDARGIGSPEARSGVVTDVDGEQAEADGDASSSTAAVAGGSTATNSPSEDDSPQDVLADEPEFTQDRIEDPPGGPVGAPSEVDDNDVEDHAVTDATEPEETEEPPEWTPPDPSEFDAPAETGESASTDNDAWSDEPVDESGDETAEEETETTDPAEIDDDATLADEGVESFSTASEDDPLSDRLPGEDDN